MTPLDVARALLDTDRAIGRLYLAGLAQTPAKLAAHYATLNQDAVSVRLQREAQAATLAAIEAEQRAHGFGTGAAELAAAERGVEPEPVERFPETRHGATLASAYDSAHGAWFETRAEYRDDRRWTGAYAEAVISAAGAQMVVSQRLDAPTAHDDAAAFVGRWARVGRAVLVAIPRTY